jgi:hypothetical protein
MSSFAFNPLHAKPAFPRDGGGSTLRAHIEASLGERLSSSLLLRERVAPQLVSTGIAVLNTLTGGLPRGALSEITGPASSGRTGVMLAALAEGTRRQEVCALVDASDSFDPASAAAAGIDLNRLLWVRCNSRLSTARSRPDVSARAKPRFPFGGVLEQVLKVTDLLLQGGGFGMVVVDMGDIPVESVLKVPLTSWFRFRRTVEPTDSVLLLIEQEPCAKTCASLVLRLRPVEVCASHSILPSMEKGHSAAPVDAVVPLPCPTLAQAGFFPTAKLDHDISPDQNRFPHLPENGVAGHATLFRGMRFHAEVVRSCMQRKSPQSSGISFELRSAL